MEDTRYLHQGTKRLEYGYTTGSCAAAASKAASEYYFTKVVPERVQIMTPKGIPLDLEVKDSKIEEGRYTCAIEKHSGDDPDVTNGVMVYATLSFFREGKELSVDIDGGLGVGRVTRAGLEQPVGAAAINSTPRQMIEKEVRAVCEEYEFYGRVEVVISIPKGVELATKTFNPRLGIEGGISVLGTSGIVEPMSERALIETIRVEMRQRYEYDQESIIVAPGNYGRAFMQEKYGIDLERAVKCSNYIGEMIDIANDLGFKRLLLVGHIGKLIKVSGGIMNTHSSYADARLELMASHALRAGADADLCRKILECITTDEALDLLNQANILQNTMNIALERIKYYIDKRTDITKIDVIMFSNEYGELANTIKHPL